MKIAIISTPRTGSTWLHNILTEQLGDKPEDFAALQEYFGVDRIINGYIPDRTKHYGWRGVFLDSTTHPERYQSTYYWDGELFIYPIYKLVTPTTVKNMKLGWERKGGVQYLSSISAQRLEWLEKDPRENILIKIHAGDFRFNPNLLKHLLKSFKVIFLNRLDTKRQIMSWLVSRATGDFGSSKFFKDKSQKKNEILCKPGWFLYIAYQLKCYEELKKQILGSPNAVEISYEKLLELQNPNKILNTLGIPTEKNRWDELYYAFSEKDLEVDHFSYFQNSANIQKWIEEMDFSKIKTPKVPLILESGNLDFDVPVSTSASI